MATRAQQFRAQSQRKGSKPKKKTARKRKHPTTRHQEHAIWVRETQSPTKRPSRKSTRKSANRTKMTGVRARSSRQG